MTYCSKFRPVAITGILIGFFCFACKKDKTETTNAPKIEFIKISPAEVKEFKDNITVVISYQDKNGDLGENDPDVQNLFVSDQRNGIVYKFRIQQLAPDNAEIEIKGNLSIVMEHTAITGSSSSEQVVYDIYLTDREGNNSNTVSTSAVTVIR